MNENVGTNGEARANFRDLFAGIGVAVGATAAILAVCLAFGWLDARPEDGDGPSGAVVSAVWTFLVAGLAGARWLLLRADPDAEGLADAIVAIGAAILAYPLFTLGFDRALIGLGGNLLIAAALILTGLRSARISRWAAFFLFLPVPWIGFASYLILRSPA